jgi:hypothetical protein
MRCPYCRDEIEAGAEYFCPSCHTPHHQKCWEENGGCTVWGCAQAPGDDAKLTIGTGEQAATGYYGTATPPTSPLPPPPEDTQYFIDRSGSRMGPYSLEEVRHFFAQELLLPNDLAWCEGMANWLPLSEVIGGARRVPPPPPPLLTTPCEREISSDAVFLYVPVARFVAMSLLTLGLYEVYWIYRNWRYLNERDNLNIQPFWRAWFGIFYIKSLLEAIKNDQLANRLASANFSPDGLATGWIAFVLLGGIASRASSPALNFLGIVLTAPSFLFLLPVQQYVNRVNESLPSRPRYYAWTAAHVVLLIIGIFIWLGTFAGWAQ